MSKSFILRVARAGAGIAVLAAFAIVPVAAQAATTTATGTLTAGSLSVTAPAITAFNAPLTGNTQTIMAAVGPWSLNDSTGNAAAYHVTVSAGVPAINTTAFTVAELASMGGTFLTLTPGTATPDASNPAPATTHPVAIVGPLALNGTAVTIEGAAAATGAGQWDFAADTTTPSLGVIVPGDAAAGSYSDVLTYTIAAGA